MASITSMTSINSALQPLIDPDIDPDIDIDIAKINKIKYKKIKQIHTFSIVIMVFSVLILIGIAISLIEYNIVLHHFNGFTGIGSFINKTTIVINELSSLANKINETEAINYINKLKIIINKVCEDIGC
jgi:hypothetical protein